MELFFKRYLWTVTAVVVALAGVVMARTVSAIAEASLAQPPETAPAASERRLPSRVSATVNGAALAALFGVVLVDPQPATEDVEIAPTGEEVASTLNARLVATIEANPPEYSIAVITDNTARQTAVYGIGDLLMGVATLVEVEARRVLVLNNGQTEYIEMDSDQGGRKLKSVASIAPAKRNKDHDTGEGIKKIGENEYIISQAEIEKTLSNLNTIATQARIVPAFKNGVAQGFKLFSIRPGSIYARIGIQNGDVIKRINGYDINSPDKALEVYSKLKDAREITVELERRGRPVKKHYSIE